MRIILFISCLFFSVWANAQLKTQVVAKTSVPKSLRYQGKPVQAVQYQDQTGTYFALTTQTGEQPQKGEEGARQAHLYAYVYQLNDNAAPTLLWQLHDLVSDCILDLEAEFVPSSITVTDLDKNGKAEVWVGYRLSCRGDISPSDLKLIMHEGTTKYAMRGVGKLKVNNVLQTDGGEISSNDFIKGPTAFKPYARQLWNKYALEVIK
ncbi:hypothetical protein HH214_15685 [Mucilaginibacter robiniae]|uniref:Uncharacterized protein n=1 Tax=Mucilaginibacter robiniae TaxID=2728022 RepID=A0A7L5E3M9_9SPHI|nr:hypothetical protein [Mucilaginibacter robiniae]QJD97208.1 hypothetical protein HH214_15685 [Mucilaginibacter robiniae]